MIKVLIVDGQDLVRIGLRTLIQSQPDLAVVGEAADGIAAIEQARRHRPDVILMDIRMAGIDGVEATRRIGADPGLSGSRVMVLGAQEVDDCALQALRNGASAFLTKDSRPAEILRAIRLVAGGEAMLSPSLTRRVLHEFASRPVRVVKPHRRLYLLTGREREVASLVGEGLSNQEIAQRLKMSPATVRTHVSRAMLKLGARDRAQLAVFAYQSGLANP